MPTIWDHYHAAVSNGLAGKSNVARRRFRAISKAPADAEWAAAVKEKALRLDPLLENPDTFVWLRGFPSAEERERMRTAFYTSDAFTHEIEPVLITMLDSYQVTLCETSAGGIFEGQ